MDIYEEYEVRVVVPFGIHFKLEALYSVAELLDSVEVLDSVHVNVKVQPDLISSNPTLTDNKF